MDMSFSVSDLAFRDEVRAFLAEQLPQRLREGAARTPGVFIDPDIGREWQHILGEKGWLASHWPKADGGTGWSAVQRYLFDKECALAGAPPLSVLSLKLVGPIICKFGTAEQKARFLPGILSGEDSWCQGYSEPGSGSDLASLKTRAMRIGDEYHVTGSKIWTTHAQFANRMFALVRTKFEGKPQQGITFLLLDMKTPGVTVKPIITLAGDHEVNQVFFDNVRVPKSGRLGAENDGWTVAKYLLEFERGGGSAPGLKVSLSRVRAMAAAEGVTGDPSFMARLASAEVAVEAIEMTEHRVLAELSEGRNPGPASSMLKTQGTEAMQRIDELAIDAIGHYANVDQPLARRPGSNVTPIGPEHGLVSMARYLNNRAGSIYGGSNEIQRDIMARMILGV